MALKLKQLAQEGATDGQAAVWDTASGEWVSATVGSKSIEILLGGPTSSDINTNSGTYGVMANFIFRGTTILGIPTAIKAILEGDSGVTVGIQIFDLTNTLTIVQSETFTGSKAILDLGTLSNLPTGEALFEIQLRRVAGSGSNRARAHALSVQF